MLNQAAVEALYSATYVENYLDCVENLPLELQRYLTRMRELDVSYQAFLKEVEQNQDAAQRDVDSVTRKRIIFRIQQMLIAAQEVGDEKLQVVQQVQDLIENKTRQLDVDYRNLDLSKEQENTEPNKDNHHNNNGQTTGVTNSTNNTSNSGERQSKRPRRTRTDTLIGAELASAIDIAVASETRASVANTTVSTTATSTCQKKSSKKKKRKSRQQTQQQQQQREESPPREDELAIDPDEPTYCLCDQISYGEMILCDNDLCPIEWFHFSCVALVSKPKGKWFCPKCRGDRPNVMKPKAQFLKELERYNKEKEEKS